MPRHTTEETILIVRRIVEDLDDHPAGHGAAVTHCPCDEGDAADEQSGVHRRLAKCTGAAVYLRRRAS